MGDAMGTDETPEKRSEVRETAQRYYSVQFTKPGLDAVYQFKLWNISQKGLCILVKEDSAVLKHLAVGDTIDMIFYLTEAKGELERFKTQIKHITKNEDGRFQGHYFIGLAIR